MLSLRHRAHTSMLKGKHRFDHNEVIQYRELCWFGRKSLMGKEPGTLCSCLPWFSSHAYKRPCQTMTEAPSTQFGPQAHLTVKHIVHFEHKTSLNGHNVLYSRHTSNYSKVWRLHQTLTFFSSELGTRKTSLQSCVCLSHIQLITALLHSIHFRKSYSLLLPHHLQRTVSSG